MLTKSVYFLFSVGLCWSSAQNCQCTLGPDKTIESGEPTPKINSHFLLGRAIHSPTNTSCIKSCERQTVFPITFYWGDYAFLKLTFLWGKIHKNQISAWCSVVQQIIVIAFEKSKARKEGWEMLGCCSFKWNGQLYVSEEVTFGQVPEEGFGGFYSYEKEIEHMNLSSLVYFNSV